MKKIIVILSLISTICLCACSNNSGPESAEVVKTSISGLNSVENTKENISETSSESAESSEKYVLEEQETLNKKTTTESYNDYEFEKQLDKIIEMTEPH